MKIISDEKWWTTGENVVKNIYTGIIADDKSHKDKIISNEMELKKFQECIAINIYKKIYRTEEDPNTYDYILYNNDQDEILRDKINFDFTKELLILINSAKINEILYSNLFDCYLVGLDSEPVEKNIYFLAVCKKIIKENTQFHNKIKFDLISEKPNCIITDRPFINNDEY